MTEDRVTKDLRAVRTAPAPRARFAMRLFGALVTAASMTASAYMLGGVGTLAYGFVSASGPDLCQTDAGTCQAVMVRVATEIGVDAATWPLYWGPAIVEAMQSRPQVVVAASPAPVYSAGVAPF